VTVILHALLLEIPEKLETQRLTLVAAAPGQGAIVNAAIVDSHEELKRWMPWAQKVPTVDESEVYCRQARAKWLARELLDFSFLSREDGTLLGRGGLHSIDWSVPKFEIGYWVRTSCARRGFATEATDALVALARDRLGARRVEISSDVRNTASRRVAEKSGFVLEGIRRNSRRDTLGEIADACLYARIF
jgi:RimJ/RimL family protein N-acetyltransferase